MKSRLSYLILSLGLFLTAPICAQTYNGVHKFDGQHRNEVKGYFMIGDNIITDTYFGLAVSYKRYLGNRFHVEGDMQMQLRKRLYSFDVKGGYRIPAKWSDFYFEGKVLYNRYQQWNTNEINFNLSVAWETPYFSIRLGESYIHYHLLHSGYSEPLTLTFGAGVSIRPRWNSWNIGLFLRNYDDFYYEAFNINWGLNFHANLGKDMQLFGEAVIRPAGSMSQLATKYEESLKLGLKYVW